MPLYMDVHKNVEGVTAEAVEEAHQKDLEVQGKYGVKFLKYWYDESSGTVFCLSEAPSGHRRPPGSARRCGRRNHRGYRGRVTPWPTLC